MPTSIWKQQSNVSSKGGLVVDEIKDTQVKKSIKDVFFEEVNDAAKVLIRKIISPTSLGIVVVVWALASLGISIYIKSNNACETPRVQLGKYLASRLLCPEK